MLVVWFRGEQLLTVVQNNAVQLALKTGALVKNAPHALGRIYELCGHGSMHVLGLSNPNKSMSLEPSWVHVSTGAADKVPTVSCARAASIQLILYDRPLPNRMQYVTLEPISLALPNKEPILSDGEDDESPEAEDERRDKEKRAAKRKLVDKLKQHIIHKRAPSSKEKALPMIVNQINWAWELEQLLLKNAPSIGRRPRRAMSVSERVAERAATARDFVLVRMWTFLTVCVFPLLLQGLRVLLVVHRAAAETLLFILEWRLGPKRAALKDVSATAQQVEIRLQQFCYWPVQFIMLLKRKNDWASVTTSHPDYIRFYNSLWLVANDMIMGIALGLYIVRQTDWVSDQISSLLMTYTVDYLQRSISWLMGWPAGLKLNSELAAFLGDLFLWVIDYWSSK